MFVKSFRHSPVISDIFLVAQIDPAKGCGRIVREYMIAVPIVGIGKDFGSLHWKTWHHQGDKASPFADTDAHFALAARRMVNWNADMKARIAKGDTGVALMDLKPRERFGKGFLGARSLHFAQFIGCPSPA